MPLPVTVNLVGAKLAINIFYLQWQKSAKELLFFFPTSSQLAFPVFPLEHPHYHSEISC